MWVSIDIEEKDKTTVLGDHRQEKKEKKQQPLLVRLDWNINTGNTQHKKIKAARLDWDLNVAAQLHS